LQQRHDGRKRRRAALESLEQEAETRPVIDEHSCRIAFAIGASRRAKPPAAERERLARTKLDHGENAMRARCQGRKCGLDIRPGKETGANCGRRVVAFDPLAASLADNPAGHEELVPDTGVIIDHEAVEHIAGRDLIR
ncbi:MAG: hypothetical protein HC829_06370, partial [Bacteroidales bacterium]|nr:hypothetical protein [Bacteroidales bacterium]